jgi:serine O-acetyltransferase
MGSGHPTPDRDSLMRERRARFPRFGEAVAADAAATALYRGERHEFRSRLDLAIQALRLAWQSDAFLAQVLYRAKARMQALGVPILPRIAHRLAMITGQVAIGDPVIVHPGVYLLHGQVVIDGLTEVHSGVTIAPFVTLGLRHGEIVGPTIEAHAHIGSGAKVVGRITVGSGAQIGANAVVLEDVAAGATVVGVPAKTAGSVGPIEQATKGKAG